MSFIKASGIKIANGFLFGVGFMLATVAVSMASYFYMEESAEKRAAKYEEERKTLFREYDETALLTLSIAREKINAHEFTLLGTVENNGDATWSTVNIKAELFNESGEFIDECSEYIMKTSRPRDAINFKLSCGSQWAVIQHEYKTYKISVVDAHYVR